MSEQRQSLHEEWSSRWMFILAAAGSAIGLGNIWKFPYIVGQNGGGAFVLMYLCFIVAIGVPVMMSEVMVGRRGRRNPVDSLVVLTSESNRSSLWQITGWMGIIAGLMVMFYYGVIAGWSVDYVVLAATGAFSGRSPTEVQGLFDGLMNNPLRMMFWNTVIIAATAFVVARGVKSGLEKTVRFMFPAILVLLLVVVIYSINTGAFQQGFEFLFKPDFSKLTAKGALIALGHAFFTLSLGQGAIMMYGAYLPKRVSIGGSILFIAAADTLVALMAGLAIFPIVFANGLPAGSGPGLLFQTVPIAFGQMPYGSFFATLFFIMVVFAAFTTTIALVEPSVVWLMERFKFKRVKTTVGVSFVIWFFSIGSVLSFNYWKDISFFGYTYFYFIDNLTANLMLPIGAVITAIFVGWMMRTVYVKEELNIQNPWVFNAWRFAVRFIVPVAITLVVLNAFGIVQF